MYDLPLNRTQLWAPIKTEGGKIAYVLRSFVVQWCDQNLDHPVIVVVRRTTATQQIIARFHNEAEAFHFKTRWWGV